MNDVVLQDRGGLWPAPVEGTGPRTACGIEQPAEHTLHGDLAYTRGSFHPENSETLTVAPLQKPEWALVDRFEDRLDISSPTLR